MKLDYYEWAEKLLDEIYHTPEDHRVELIKSHLMTAHKTGDETGWIDDQEATLNKLTEQAQKDGFYNGTEMYAPHWNEYPEEILQKGSERLNQFNKELAEKCNSICNHIFNSKTQICMNCGVSYRG